MMILWVPHSFFTRQLGDMMNGSFYLVSDLFHYNLSTSAYITLQWSKNIHSKRVTTSLSNKYLEISLA